jgi:hypothetical protein
MYLEKSKQLQFGTEVILIKNLPRYYLDVHYAFAKFF